MNAPEPRETPAVEHKWSEPGSAQHYARGRFHSERRAALDPRLVSELLRGNQLCERPRILDAPCGAGRLTPTLAALGSIVSLDANAPMLAAARQGEPRLACVQAGIERLPFADASFDAVVCCRLLHHLHSRDQLERAVSELVRVSRDLVVASFWDAASLPGLRLRLGLKRDEGPRGRVFASRALLRDVFARAGAPVLEFRGVLRFVTQQTFLVARRSARP